MITIVGTDNYLRSLYTGRFGFVPPFTKGQKMFAGRTAIGVQSRNWDSCLCDLHTSQGWSVRETASQMGDEVA